MGLKVLETYLNPPPRFVLFNVIETYLKPPPRFVLFNVIETYLDATPSACCPLQAI